MERLERAHGLLYPRRAIADVNADAKHGPIARSTRIRTRRKMSMKGRIEDGTERRLLDGTGISM